VKKIYLTLLICINGLFAYDVNIISQENKDHGVTPKTIEKAFKDAGFFIADNRDMTGPFMKQFKQSDFEIYNLLTIFNIDAVAKLIEKYPEIGLFTPMSMSIYTKKGESKLHAAFLSIDAMSKITGIPATNPIFKELGMNVRKVLAKAFPKGEYEVVEYDIAKTDKELVTRTDFKLDPKTWEDDSDYLTEEFDSKLEVQGFVQAGFTDINFYLNKRNNKNFDIFFSESICKLPVIYTVAKIRPEAGAFAPCSMSMYKSKDSNILHVAYPNVYNWISSLAIEDKASIDVLLKAQKQVEVILKGLGE
jgi:uncharacterized protein (DUF302 family)